MKNKPTKSILFVDDEQQEIKYFEKAFAKDFTILTANSVGIAIQAIEAHHEDIAVVITDQRMPGQVGVELLDYINTNYPNIVRILTTAYCDTGSAIDAINKAQVFRYIPKPWDLDDLHDSLNQALHRFQYAANNEQAILESFGEDCAHWLAYSAHAHGDEFVYRSGLEAIAFQYNQRLDQHLEADNAAQVKGKISMMINDKYTQDSVIQQIQLSKGRGLFKDIH